MASFIAQKTQRRLNLANERARDEKTVRNVDQTMAPAATRRHPSPSAVLMSPNRSGRKNWPRRSNGERSNDRIYGTVIQFLVAKAGTYVTVASEYEEETNGPYGYHGDTRRERANRDEGHDEVPEPEGTRRDGDSSSSEKE